MTGPPPAVAEVRVAVREALRREGAARVLVACSGGPDSVALAAAVAFTAPRLGVAAGLVTVDHGLQDGSAERAGHVAAWGRELGLDPVVVAPVTVPVDGSGPEAAARTARYAALLAAARDHDATAVLLGHTLDDQAETCLLALARGAGPRGLAGMPARRVADGVALLRPLLAVRREVVHRAAAESGWVPWLDPHNADPRYARSRVRHELLPSLVAALGDGVVGNLARTARQLADDSSYLDEVAAGALAAAFRDGGLVVADVAGLPPAVRGRVLHRFALAAGASAGVLGHRHVEALETLVLRWRGQGPVHLPGGVLVERVAGALVVNGGRMPL